MQQLTTAQIAKAFLVPETTVAQRITRAKRKIASVGVPYRIPTSEEVGGRLAAVLAVIYLLFNEAYLSTSGERAASRDLADGDIARLFGASDDPLHRSAVYSIGCLTWRCLAERYGEETMFVFANANNAALGSTLAGRRLCVEVVARRAFGSFFGSILAA